MAQEIYCLSNEKRISFINIFDYVIDITGIYETQYFEVTYMNDFLISVHNDNTNLDIDIKYSLDGTSDIDKSFIDETINFPASLNFSSSSTKKLKARYLRLILNGVDTQNINLQVCFKGY